MPPSMTGSESNPSVLPYVISVAGLVTSLMLTSFGYAKESWVILRRERYQDELQRGIRGHDCYKTDYETQGKKLKCLPWEFVDKSVNFPAPFNEVTQPNFLTFVIMYLALLIISLQIFWICYTFGYCCCDPFAKKAEKLKSAAYQLFLLTVCLWFSTAFLVFLQTMSNNILPKKLFKQEYDIQIGDGCWLFVIGGVVPFLIASFGLFEDQFKESLKKMFDIANQKHQLLPTSHQDYN